MALRDIDTVRVPIVKVLFPVVPRETVFVMLNENVSESVVAWLGVAATVGDRVRAPVCVRLADNEQEEVAVLEAVVDDDIVVVVLGDHAVDNVSEADSVVEAVLVLERLTEPLRDLFAVGECRCTIECDSETLPDNVRDDG